MLRTAMASSAVKHPYYRPTYFSHKPEVSCSLTENNITLNITVPPRHSDGKDILITRRAAIKPSLRDGVIFSVVQEMIQWIEDHSDQPLSVERISDKSGYSLWHFQRKFVQLTGLNVYEYVRIRRVINATFALVRSKRRILEIAVENGFNCQTTFTRAIKGMTGYTPAVIRKKFSADEQQWIAMIDLLVNPQRSQQPDTAPF